MATNDLLLQMTKASLNAIGDVLGEKIDEGITLLNSDSDDLADFKESCKDEGLLKNIPDEVYREIMNAYYDALKKKDSGKVFEELTASGKTWTDKIDDVIDTLTRPVSSRSVKVDTGDGTDTYKISFPLSKVGIDSVAKVTKGGTNISFVYWDNEFFGKTALFKYFWSLWTIEKKLSDAVLGACFDVLKDNAPELLQAVYTRASSSEVTELLGTSATATAVKNKIEKALPKNSYLNSALTKYGDLTKSYDNLQKVIDSPKSNYSKITKATEKFIAAREKLVSYLATAGVDISIADLPDVLDPTDPHIKYNTAMTEVSILSGHSEKFDAAEFDSKIKNIYATELTDAIEIIGNAKANKIYGGASADSISGGKGKDSLWGGAGCDSIFGEAGNDQLFGGAGDDLLSGGKGKDTLLGEDGNDLLFGEEDNDQLFGEAGNDTLFGNKGNDSLWGGDGSDVFYYESSDGNDVIFDYAAEDKIFLANGSIDKVTVSGGTVTFKIGTGSIKVRDVSDTEITVVFADKSERKYLNGALVATE